MTITNIKIRKVFQDKRLRALVSVVINDDFAVHDIKIIEGPERLFVAMPSRREGETFRDIAHPITSDARTQLENSILGTYQEYLAQLPEEPEQETSSEPERTLE